MLNMYPPPSDERCDSSERQTLYGYRSLAPEAVRQKNGAMCDTLRACGWLLLALLHASLCSAYTLVKCDRNDALRLSGNLVIQ